MKKSQKPLKTALPPKSSSPTPLADASSAKTSSANPAENHLSSATPAKDPSSPISPAKTPPVPSIFTKIIRGEIPCYKIYEDEKTFAFLDINPETKGHTLVVPKLQVDKLYDLPEDDYIALMLTAKKLSRHLEDKTGARILWKVVGTDVPHAHIHLEPLDKTWTYGRHLSLSPEEFESLRSLLFLPS